MNVASAVRAVTRKRLSGVQALVLLVIAAVIVACFAYPSYQRHQLGRQLVKAVYENKADAVGVLLQQGADANIRDYQQEEENYLLGWLKSFFDRKPADASGVPILISASQMGNAEVVRALLKHGANPNVRRAGVDTTPLMEAASMCDVDKMKLLLDAGADINARDGQGRTAIHSTVSGRVVSNSINAIQLLVDRGADINVRDKQGMTVLKMVQGGGYSERDRILAFLVQAGAKE